MAGSFAALATRMRKAADRVPTLASETAKQVTFTILNDLAFRTPVDTSTARSNWQVSIGAPIADNAEIPAFYLGEFGSTGQASAQAAIAAGRDVLSRKKPGETLYLSNVLDYIVPLNEGHSKQEPAGMVDRAVLIGRKVVSKARLFD